MGASRALESLFIFIICLAIFTIGFSNHEFVQFESRFGMFAQEMFRNGPSFFPTTYQQYYPDYPATQTFLSYLISRINGQVTFLTVILPSAIASALTVMCIYLIGSLHQHRVGIIAALFALFTYEFVAEARTISLDQFTTAATVFCFYCVYSSTKFQVNKRLFWIPIIWILSFSFRGAIGLIIPAVIVCTYYLLEKNFRYFIISAVTALASLSLCLIALFAAAQYEGGPALVHSVIQMQITHRVGSSASVPFYYYFLACFLFYAIPFPLSIVIYSTQIKTFFRSDIPSKVAFLRHLAAWVLVILIGMSIPSDEKLRYILPIAPALALSAAFLYDDFFTSKAVWLFRQILFRLNLLLPWLGFVFTIGAFFYSRIESIPFELPLIKLGLFFGLLNLVSYLILRNVKDIFYREMSALCLGVFTFLFIEIGIAQPIDMQLNRVQPFVQEVELLRTNNQAIVFYKIGPDGEDIKFMVTLNKDIQPQFVQTEDALLRFSQPAIFIAKSSDFDNLSAKTEDHFKMLYKGRLGHVDGVVFENRSVNL